MHTFRLCAVILGTLGVLFGAAALTGSAKELKAPRVEARLVFDDGGKIIVEVLSHERLVNPQVQHYVGQWVRFHEPKAQEGRLLYRAKSYYTLSENVVLSLKSAAPKEGNEFLTSLVVPQFSAQAKAPVALNVGKTELVEAGKTAGGDAPGGDVGLGIINRYRAQRGLAPIQYDAEYAKVSRINNEMGGVHRYNTGWQTWASPSDPEAAVSMWMGAYYNSHGVIIMNPSITRGGTNSHPTSGTTFTGG